ncbi:MAG: 3'(2'),5'-bisphosphate nucleotidase CysQ [Leptospira sp.]|nr:3'(2'),5'-bisphosphate nucleotidase CysQ [Leptospira sp.]
MNENDYEKVWNWILEVGDEILAIYKSDFKVKDKGINDPVTEADIKASEFLQKRINETYPEHGFLSEEKKDDDERLKKEWVWILDPIDGTREFVKKNDQFALSLGLVRSGVLVWGVIFNPATGEFFSKKDFTFNTKLKAPFFTKDNLKILIQSSKVPSIVEIEEYSIQSKPKLTVSLSELKEGLFEKPFWRENFNINPMGSIAYKLGLLSAGHIDLIVSLKPKSEWDICGGLALLSESQFKFFPLSRATDYLFNQKDTRSYGLVAGKAKAVQYLDKHVSRSELSLQVKDKW